MKNQTLFSTKDKSKKLKYRLLQYLFGALRVNTILSHLEVRKTFIPPEIQAKKLYRTAIRQPINSVGPYGWVSISPSVQSERAYSSCH